MKKLLIIHNDAMQDYIAKGNSKQERMNYFNPTGFFDVYALNWKEEEKSEYAGIKIFPLFLGMPKSEIFKIETNKNEFDNLMIKNRKNISHIVNEIKPDIVRGYNGHWAAGLSGFIGKEFSIPSLTSVHDLHSTNKSILDVDKIICVSNSVKEYCINLTGPEYENKMVVVFNGINLDLFYKRTDEEMKEIKSRFNSRYKSISVGRFCKEKNLERLVQSIGIIKKEFPDLIHLHFGLGELKDEISDMINQSNLNDTIYLMGNTTQEKLAKYYSWADVFLFPSLTEGLPNVLVEAMACGCPIITSNLPPMNEVIANNVNGILIDPYDINDIAEKTIMLLEDRKLRNGLVSNAIEESKKYDSKKKEEKEVQIYKEMLGL